MLDDQNLTPALRGSYHVLGLRHAAERFENSACNPALLPKLLDIPQGRYRRPLLGLPDRELLEL
jgi:hypothetical protein